MTAMLTRQFLPVLFAVFSFVCSSELSASSSQTEHFVLKSEDGNTTYFVSVWLPNSYPSGSQPYPSLLMLDGDYAFNAATQISSYLQRSGEIQEFLIIGVSYDVGFGKPLAVERTRDFTPPVDRNRVISKVETQYFRFIRDTLLPEIRSRYRIDPANRVLWGYSLSGSFAAWLNFVDPTLFDHYILASGNLLDFGLSQKLFQGELFSDTRFSGRKVIMTYDETEIPDPMIIEDANKLFAREGAFPGYEVKFLLTQDESHASSWFVALPASLRFVFRK